jgi:hypothetical protein
MDCRASHAKAISRVRPPAGKFASGKVFFWAICCLGGLSSLGWASPNLQLFSDPPSLRADTQTTAIITAQVQNDSGAPVSDGTTVNFSTTLGAITPAAETRGGVARAVLTCGAAAGTAIISALSGGARTDIEVEFTGAGGEIRPTTSLLLLEGDELTYYRDSHLVLGNKGGRFEYGGIVITADCLQCDLNETRVLAQGAVEVSNGKETAKADAVIFQARKGQGNLLRYEQESAKVYKFIAPGLELSPDDTVPAESFQAFHPQAERNLVRAKKICARPDGKLLFNDAVMQLDGVDLISLPQYVADVRGGEAGFAEQVFSMNKAVGLMADFPYYYDASPNHFGCLRLTHNVTPEGAMQKRGWGLNLDEQYLLGKDGRGSLNLDNLTEGYRGVRWSHTQKLSLRSELVASLSSTQFDDSSSRVFDASTSYSRSLPGLSLGLSLRASMYSASKVYTAGLSAVTPAKPISTSKFSYSTGLRVNYGLAKAVKAYYSVEDGSLQLTSADTMSDWLSESLYFRLNCPKWKIGNKSDVTSSVSLANSWSASGVSQTLSANTGIYRKLNEKSNLRLSYGAYLSRSGSSSDSLTHRQTLNLNLNYNRPSRFESVGFATFDVESNRFTGSASLSYYPNFQRTANNEPQWVINFSGLINRWNNSSFNELKMGLVRAVGNWQVSFNYSPQGSESDSGLLTGTNSLTGLSGYGFVQELGRTFWIEIAPRTF